MDAILLAAGYGTRLYPLTKDTPKALLPLGPKDVVLDGIMEELVKVPDLRRVVMVTNHRFAEPFQGWVAKRRGSRIQTEVIDDGTSTNETRLGAIRDLMLGLERLRPAQDVLVLGTDNLFSWSLVDLVRAATSRGPAATMAVREVPTLEEASRMGVVKVDANQRILECLEKPKQPPSRLISLCVYYFPAAMHRRFEEFVRGGGNPDAPGFFMEWLVKTEPVYSYPTSGEWLDIGSPETYRQAVEWWSARGSARAQARRAS